MPEKFSRHPEQHNPMASAEKEAISDEIKHYQEHPTSEGAAVERDPLLQSVNALKARADQEAISAKEYDKPDYESSPSQAFVLHRDLKDDAYRQTLQKAQRHLSGIERTFSKLIHQPAVEAASNTAASTIGRPSGLFTGGLFALLGSSFLLYMSKRYGFSYNYGVFVLCLVSGFMLGLIAELVWRKSKRR